MKTSRIIFHIDMNAFFASCEISENPELKGKPVVIAHDDPFQRSIIVSPSYEARKYGIKAPMRVKEAFELCKNIVVVEPDYELYVSYSRKFYHYLLTITKNVQMASIDEAFLDVTDLNCDYVELAKKMQTELYEKYNLPSSIGIAPNKFLAKMASDMKKPMGITILRKREIDKLLWPLKVSDMIGVGKKTAPKLNAIGIKTIGDLANFKNKELLVKTVGEQSAKYLVELANGIDDSIVDSEIHEDFQSVSNAHTFIDIEYDIKEIKRIIKLISGSLSNSLEKNNYKAKTIGLRVRDINNYTITKSKSIEEGISNEYEIYDILEDLFDDYCDADIGIRYVCGYCQRTFKAKEVKQRQLSLFDDLNEIEKEEELKKILSNVNKRFGKDTIKKGYYSFSEKDKKGE